MAITPKRNLAQPKGELIFKSGRVRKAERGERKDLSFNAVQWVSKGEKLIEGRYGTIFMGKVKFGGMGPPKRCIIKEISRPSGTDYREVVARLNRSLADHPRMALFVRNRTQYLVREAFVRSAKDGPGRRPDFPLRIPKLGLAGKGIFESLNLDGNPDHYDFFRQATTQAGALARAGLRISKTADADGQQFIDAFDSVRLSDGKIKVLVVRMDNIYPENDHYAAWRESTQALLDVVHSKNPKNKKAALGIFEMTGGQFDFVG